MMKRKLLNFPMSNLKIKKRQLAIFVLALLMIVSLKTYAQKSNTSKSTKDLSFLIGKWKITRTYRHASKKPRVLKGTLSCEWTMDKTFIKCVFEMKRPGRTRALDVVYFNYNRIYKQYEHLWLSSTWPVKVLMQGNMSESAKGLVLKSAATFSIGKGVTEYVKGELMTKGKGTSVQSFQRKTHIRTSRDKKGVWLYHMLEEAKRAE